MKRGLLVVTSGALAAGCVTTAGLVKKDKVTVPIFAAAVAADLVISSIVMAAATDLSTAGAIASGVAFTAVDVGIGCITGACSVLRP
jgi:hypothetical protein